jgi:hypothetical protein
MVKRLTVAGVIIILLSPLFAGLTFAQVDPEKALIGRWAGPSRSIKKSGTYSCD